MPVSNLPLLYEGEGDVNVQALSVPRYWLPIAPNLTAAPGIPDDIALAIPVLQAARLYERDISTQADIILAMTPADSVITQVAFRDLPDGGSQRAYRVEEPEAGTERGALEAALGRDTRSLAWVQVSRRPPDPPDIVALRSEGKMRPRRHLFDHVVPVYCVTGTIAVCRRQLPRLGERSLPPASERAT